MNDTSKNKLQNVSFVIPAFNAEKTVAEAVESIFNGNFEHGEEVIIVNDYSTDSTDRVLKSLANKHPEIKVVNNERNLGCPASRNVGTKLAQNNLIFSLDADNVLAPGAIRKMKLCLETRGADVAAFGDIRFFIKNPRRVTHLWKFPYPYLELADLFAGHTNPAFTSQFLYKKSIWEKISGYWEYGKGLHEGWGFAFKLLVNNIKFAVCQEAVYFHRYGHSSLFTRENSKLKESSSITMKMIKPFLDRFEKKDVNRIQDVEWKDIWFDKLDENPVKVKNAELGKAAEIILIQPPIYKKILRKILRMSKIPQLARLTKNNFTYWYDYTQFRKLSKSSDRSGISFSKRKKILGENTTRTRFDAHYIYHPAWAARIIAETKPKIHTDISSSLSFSSMLSAFVPVRFYDYRPASLRLSNLTSEKADLMKLPFEDSSVDSLSCMHTIEHIGLGRYGDPIDPDGDLKAMRELQRVLSLGGNLLFVVPIGRPKVVFNAHRVYSYEQIIKYFEVLKLKEFSLIPDNGQETGIIKNASKELADTQNYGCGCFWFIKSNDKH